MYAVDFECEGFGAGASSALDRNQRFATRRWPYWSVVTVQKLEPVDVEKKPVATGEHEVEAV